MKDRVKSIIERIDQINLDDESINGADPDAVFEAMNDAYNIIVETYNKLNTIGMKLDAIIK